MKKKYKILICIAGLLIVIRIILPYVLLHYANKTLASLKGYSGHIEDLDLSIYRGAYSLDNIYLNKVDSVSLNETDFFKAKTIDLSVDWSAIFHGALAGDLEFESPVLIFTKDKVEPKDVKKDFADFQKLLKDFMPLKVNRFEAINGELHYADKTTKPKVDIALKKMHILALNLSNVTDDKIELPSTVTANASVYDGILSFNMKLNALNEHPTFDLNTEIKNTNLVLLNDFLQAYGNFDVNKGTFGLYAEMAAKKGKFKGYVKPIVKDLDVVGPTDKHDNFFNKVYEQTVGVAGVLLKNQKKDQVATRIDIEGDFKNPETSTIDAIWEMLRNAFIQALMPVIDNKINLMSVDISKPEDKRNLFQRIFKSDKKKNGKKQ